MKTECLTACCCDQVMPGMIAQLFDAALRLTLIKDPGRFIGQGCLLFVAGVPWRTLGYKSISAYLQSMGLNEQTTAAYVELLGRVEEILRREKILQHVSEPGM